MKETNVNALSPWAEYIHKLEALFGQDPEITIRTDDSIPGIWLLVDDQDKADALAKLLPEKEIFGNVELKITIVPSNFSDSTKRLVEKAFDKNPAFAFAKTIVPDMLINTNDITYAVFKPEVVQYWANNLGDIYGNKSTLYQDLAKDVFNEIPGLFWCTDKKTVTRYKDYQSYVNLRKRD